MQISLSSALIGLVAGAAIGFIAATTIQNLSGNGPSGSRLANTDSPARQNHSQTDVAGESITNNTTAVAPFAAENTSSTIVSSGNVDLEQLVSQKKYASGFSAELNLINQIGQADFDELQSLAISLLEEPRQHLVNHSLQLIGLRMVELDRDETMHFLFTHFSEPSSARSIYEVHSIIDALAGTHYNELISWADNLPDKDVTYGIRSQVVAGLARVDPEKALAAFSEFDTGQHDDILYSLLHGWADVDPQSAMMWALDQQGNQQGNQQGARQEMHPAEIVFGQWVAADYSNAEAFLQNVGDQELKARLEFSLINEMSYKDPQSAIELALNMEEGQSRSQAFEAAFYGWSSNSLMDAIDFATHSLSGEDQQRAYYIIGMSAGSSSPEQFGASAYDTMLMTESMPPVLGEQIRMSTMYQFFQEDSHAALQWLDTIADPNERDQLLSTVAYDMAQTDLALAQSMFDQSSEHVQMMLGNGIAMELYSSNPESAWSWYEQMPEGQVKSSVLSSMIYGEAQTNPDRAMQLALDNPSVEDENLMMSVFASAAGTNPQWANDWLDQADIAPDMANQLRSMLKGFRFGGHDNYMHFGYDRYYGQ